MSKTFSQPKGFQLQLRCHAQLEHGRPKIISVRRLSKLVNAKHRPDQQLSLHCIAGFSIAKVTMSNKV